MFKNIKLNKAGFTIVETLIVLAIAAVIIIIVLLAVPALQRTARNNNIKNDATTVASGITEFESNNGGLAPNSIVNVSSTLTVKAATGTAITTNVAANDHVVTWTTAGATAPAYTGGCTVAQATVGTCVAPGQISVDIGHQCPTGGGNIAGANAPANTSAFAIFFPIESSGVGCVQA